MSTINKIRTGIFGGSFNPIHNSHLSLCAYAKIALNLDRIILIPTGDNPYKQDSGVSRYDRYQMALLAVEGLSGYEVSDIEINRPGKTYTVDTIRELNKDRDDAYYFISGSDILMQLGDWKHFDELAKLTNFAVVKRKDTDNSMYLIEAERLHNIYGAGIYLLEDYMPKNLSSTVVRDVIKSGDDFKELVPEKVYEYIKDKGLYK